MKVKKKNGLAQHRKEQITTHLSGLIRTNIFEEAFRQADAVQKGLTVWQARQHSPAAKVKQTTLPSSLSTSVKRSVTLAGPDVHAYVLVF